MAGFAVTAADPSGLWGLLKETFASGRALIRGRATAGRTRRPTHAQWPRRPRAQHFAALMHQLPRRGRRCCRSRRTYAAITLPIPVKVAGDAEDPPVLRMTIDAPPDETREQWLARTARERGLPAPAAKSCADQAQQVSRGRGDRPDGRRPTQAAQGVGRRGRDRTCIEPVMSRRP